MLQLKIRTSNSRFVFIKSLPDALTFLEQWKSAGPESFFRAIDLLQEAVHGRCKPSAALLAFEKFAAEQGVLAKNDPDLGSKAFNEIMRLGW